jgi:formylglycine-generating enzyme required for sulfatase activity
MLIKSKVIKILFLVISVLFTFLFFMGKISAQKSEPKAKKKLYISSIKANGVPAAAANRVKEGIRLAIFEGFGAGYHVLDDDAIKVMYKQAEAILASGCNEKSCITQIAEGINADEIVYGEVSQEGSKIGISITNMERKGLSLGTKSIVKIAFLESQMDWFTSETAKKLMNPAYKIDTVKAPIISEEVKIGGIEIKSVEKLDIGVIQFKTSDESLERIIAVLKKNVGEADAIYAKNNYSKACGRYEDIITDINERLRPEQQKKVKEFYDGIIKRMDTAWVMQYKPDIDKVDEWIKEKKDLEEKQIQEALNKYGNIEKDVVKIPNLNMGAKSQLLEAINDRRDNIHIALLSIYEKRGDLAYRDYKFDSAIVHYKAGQTEAERVVDTNKKNQNEEKIQQKISTTNKTGRGYIENQIKLYADQAEYLYFDRQESAAKAAMKNAYELLTGPMKVFATTASAETYNKMATVMKIDILSSNDEPKLFAAIDEQNRIYEAEARKFAAIEEKKRQKIYTEEMRKKGFLIVKEIGGIKFVKLPPGSFIMGSREEDGNDDEHPQHKVIIDGFWIGMYEVTQKQYQDIMKDNPSYFNGYNLPVENISWNDATEFCKRFSKKYNVEARLPYEAEWEYACRAGSTTTYYWGDEPDEKYCWFSYCSDKKTQPVGQKIQNRWGLFDMSGNVSEWCMDWYNNEENYYQNSPAKNPKGLSSGSDRVLRGGSWDDDYNNIRSATRYRMEPSNTKSCYGFRVVVLFQ